MISHVEEARCEIINWVKRQDERGIWHAVYALRKVGFDVSPRVNRLRTHAMADETGNRPGRVWGKIAILNEMRDGFSDRIFEEVCESRDGCCYFTSDKWTRDQAAAALGCSVRTFVNRRKAGRYTDGALGFESENSRVKTYDAEMVLDVALEEFLQGLIAGTRRSSRKSRDKA